MKKSDRNYEAYLAEQYKKTLRKEQREFTWRYKYNLDLIETYKKWLTKTDDEIDFDGDKTMLRAGVKDELTRLQHWVSTHTYKKVMINGFEWWFDPRTRTVFEVQGSPTGTSFNFLTKDEIRQINEQRRLW